MKTLAGLVLLLALAGCGTDQKEEPIVTVDSMCEPMVAAAVNGVTPEIREEAANYLAENC